MLGTSRANRLDNVRLQVTLTAALLFMLAGCSHIDAPAVALQSPTALTMAFGLTTGTSPQSGARQAAELISGETLVGFSRDGRPQARLAESWSVSADGLSLSIRLRNNATFHDGQPVTAAAVRDTLARQLPAVLGPAFADIGDIRATSSNQVDFVLKHRSFLLEGLADVGIRAGELPGGGPNNTGPFRVLSLTDQGAEMVANEKYYGGKPSISRIEIKPYGSVRAAWAEMLRGNVDMLYEVGTDALASLEPSNNIRVITNQRNYAYAVILNVQRTALKSSDFRVALNAAVDRDALVADVLKGHATPAKGTVWPHHWAYEARGTEFSYAPRLTGSESHRFTCLVLDASHERLALALQKQLHAVGVEMDLKRMSLDEGLPLVRAGSFDAFLADFQLGSSLLQPYRFWRSGGPRNWGHFSDSDVDRALDAIRDASNDDQAYRSGVAAFQRAIFNNPPAIFLAWTERARAVSTRFEVAIEPGRDILGTLRQWRPLSPQQVASRN